MKVVIGCTIIDYFFPGGHPSPWPYLDAELGFCLPVPLALWATLWPDGLCLELYSNSALDTVSGLLLDLLTLFDAEVCFEHETNLVLLTELGLFLNPNCLIFSMSESELVSTSREPEIHGLLEEDSFTGEVVTNDGGVLDSYPSKSNEVLEGHFLISATLVVSVGSSGTNNSKLFFWMRCFWSFESFNRVLFFGSIVTPVHWASVGSTAIFTGWSRETFNAGSGDFLFSLLDTLPVWNTEVYYWNITRTQTYSNRSRYIRSTKSKGHSTPNLISFSPPKTVGYYGWVWSKKVYCHSMSTVQWISSKIHWHQWSLCEWTLFCRAKLPRRRTKGSTGWRK